MRVLVTGAGGFIGSHVCRNLAVRGFDVTGVYRTHAPSSFCGPSFCEGGRLSLVRADLTDPATLPQSIDALVHCAATSPQGSTTDGTMVRDNVVAVRNLLAWAEKARVDRVIFTSSISVYGRIESGEVDECTPIVDPDAYGLTKRAGECLLEDQTDRFNGLALRLPGVLGPESHRIFLADVLARLRRHDPVRACNPEGRFNNAVHVDELSALIGHVLRTGWHGYDMVTLGAAGAVTMAEAIRRLARACGSRSEIEFEPCNRTAFTISSRKAIERYGYRPSDIRVLLDRFAIEARRTQ